MTNKELVSELSEQLGWTQVKASEALALTVEQLNNTLADSTTVTISNFGVFETRKKAERISVNPQTQQRYLVPPKISVNFRPSAILKEKFK